MANIGFDGCDVLGAMRNNCPSGVQMTIQMMPTNPDQVPRPRCFLPDFYENYDEFGEGVPPVLQWDDANQILASPADAGYPAIAVMCNGDGVQQSVMIRTLFSDGTFKDANPGSPVSNENGVVQYDYTSSQFPGCTYRYTFTCMDPGQ